MARVTGESSLRQVQCSTSDSTTGGGWLPPGGRFRRIFAVEAGTRPNTPPFGRLLFVDPVADERLQGTVLFYPLSFTNTRHMEGVGDVDGETATFQLDVTDVTEPGKQDEFRLSYQTETGTRLHGPTVIGGGNIQIRPLCGLESEDSAMFANSTSASPPKWTGPLPAPPPETTLAPSPLPPAPLRS
ncbi:MAG TPA: post-COAP-1 domain-containing protein [Actinomycetota bacterium]|nr:post-COAP-1 domain-containing protein [Actinomycetota bacterium]